MVEKYRSEGSRRGSYTTTDSTPMLINPDGSVEELSDGEFEAVMNYRKQKSFASRGSRSESAEESGDTPPPTPTTGQPSRYPAGSTDFPVHDSDQLPR